MVVGVGLGGWGGWVGWEGAAVDPHRDLGTSSAFFFFLGIFQGAMLSRLTAEEEKAERLAPLLPRRQVPHAANLVSSPAPKSSDASEDEETAARRESEGCGWSI